MKKIIILIAIVAVLAGGGYFAWTTLSSGKGEREKATASAESEGGSGESEGGSGESEDGANDNLPFVDLDAITAPFIRDGRFAQYVVLMVTLEVADAEAKEAVRKNIPRIRDAFVSELHALAAIRSPQQKLINLARVKARMMAGAERVLGEGVVTDVLVQFAS